jgi:hypothetical protein
MSADELKSGSHSAATSPSAPRPDPLKNENLSEAAFLQGEAQTAKAAIVRTLEDLKEDLRTAADLRLWTEQHPWAALGIASLAGFMAASVVVPSPNGHAEPAQEQQAAQRRESRGGWAWLMVPLFDLLKTSVEKYATMMIHAASRAERGEEEAAPAEAGGS